jgi:hypothetical protein
MKIKIRCRYVCQHPKFFPGCEKSQLLFRAFGVTELTPVDLPHLVQSGATIEFVGDIHMIDEKEFPGKRSKNSVLIEGEPDEDESENDEDIADE